VSVTPTQSAESERGRGVYGLRFDLDGGGALVDRSLLVDAGDGWPDWEITWERLGPTSTTDAKVVESWDLDHALLAAQPSGWITLDRAAARTTLHLHEAPIPATVLHPYLASTAVVAGHWLGRTPFHGGAFMIDGRAWGVLGGRQMGKSSLLMCLHRAGVPVLADDVVVLDGDTAYAGPRCLDLRQSAAERFDDGEYLGVVGTRERWRVTLPPVPGEVPFGGWILLDWNDHIELARPDATARLKALVGNAGLTAPGIPTAGILDVLHYPMITFGRPRDWAQADTALEHLLEAVSAAAPEGR
jgi:hypothetical protein